MQKKIIKACNIPQKQKQQMKGDHGKHQQRNHDNSIQQRYPQLSHPIV